MKPAEFHIDAALTNFAVELGVGGPFVADKIYPRVPVKKESDKYWIFESPELRDDVDGHRAAGAEATEIDWGGTTTTYSCEEYAFRRLLSDRAKSNSDNPVLMEQQTVRKLMHKIRMGIEKRIKTVVMDTSIITNNASPSVKWDAASGTITIEKDIDTAKEAVAVACGNEPNIILIPPEVATAVKRDSTIRDLVKYTNPNLLVDGGLPQTLFGLKVIVPGAIENTANPAATVSLARIWSTDNVLVAFVDPDATVDTYTLGVQFWAKMLAEQVDEIVALWRYREESRHGEWFEVGVLVDECLVSASCGYLIDDVLTA